MWCSRMLGGRRRPKGVSAGSLCWHVGGTTDSFGPTLVPVTNRLAFLPWSNSPHHDAEEQRRPLIHRLIAEGTLPDGYATENGTGLVFSGTELQDAFTEVEGQLAYALTRDGAMTAKRRSRPGFSDRTRSALRAGAHRGCCTDGRLPAGDGRSGRSTSVTKSISTRAPWISDWTGSVSREAHLGLPQSSAGCGLGQAGTGAAQDRTAPSGKNTRRRIDSSARP